MLDTEQIIDALVCGVDFSDAGAVSCLLLPDGFSCDGTTAAADDVSREGAVLVQFEGSAIGNCVAKLASPACITEGGEFMALFRRHDDGGNG
jgi:hypothetical protein